MDQFSYPQRVQSEATISQSLPKYWQKTVSVSIKSYNKVTYKPLKGLKEVMLRVGQCATVRPLHQPLTTRRVDEDARVAMETRG